MEILGNKIGMTQIFNKEGIRIPVTLIKTGPCIVTQIKTSETDGYNAIQFGYENSFSTKKISYPEYKHLEKSNILFNLNVLKEFKIKNISDFKLGDIIDLKYLKKGDFVTISAKSTGKGTAGNIKRHHFKRGPMSHGSKHHRLQGSLGAGTTPGRVFPGKKMSGHLGFKQCTFKNLEIIDLKINENLIIIKGSIPGKFGNLVRIKKEDNYSI